MARRYLNIKVLRLFQVWARLRSRNLTLVEFGRDGLLVLICLENRIDRLDDCYVPMCLAVDDDVVNVLFHARHVDRMLLGKSVVPAAIPDSEKVGVFLICTGQLCAGKLLNVDVAFGVGVFGKLSLCRRIGDAKDQYRADDGEGAVHVRYPLLAASRGHVRSCRSGM